MTAGYGCNRWVTLVKLSVKVSRPPTRSFTACYLSISIFWRALSIWIWTIEALLTYYYYAVSSLVLAKATWLMRNYPEDFLLSVNIDSSFFLWLFKASFNILTLLLSCTGLELRSSSWLRLTDDGFLMKEDAVFELFSSRAFMKRVLVRTTEVKFVCD